MPRWATGLGLLVVAAAAGGLAWVAALLGTKGLVATVGGIAVVCLLLFVKERSVFFTFVAVCSLALLLHKSLGPQDLTHGGGAISVYITSFDLVLLLLYGLWIAEGTFVRDVKAAASRPMVWLPLAALLLLLPSLLVAADVRLAAGELVRMGWMYLLYAYVAIRVRTRRHVWAVLGGLGAVAAVETVVVLLQWRTGGVLGLELPGYPRVADPADHRRGGDRSAQRHDPAPGLHGRRHGSDRHAWRWRWRSSCGTGSSGSPPWGWRWPAWAACGSPRPGPRSSRS